MPSSYYSATGVIALGVVIANYWRGDNREKYIHLKRMESICSLHDFKYSRSGG